jgi:hypothetical protein
MRRVMACAARMSVKPQVLCWMMCDAVHIDPATGKHYIMGCFSNIRTRQFPAQHPRMVWFLTLTDVTVGQHNLRISLGPSVDQLQTVVERPFESQSPLHKINLINEIHNLPLPEPGQYAIMVEVDEEPILVSNLGVSS